MIPPVTRRRSHIAISTASAVGSLLLAGALGASSAQAQVPLFLTETPYDPPGHANIFVVNPGTGALTLRGELGAQFSPVLALAAADGRTLYAAGTDNAGTICTGETFSCLLLKIVLDPSSTVPQSVEVVGPFRTGDVPVAEITGMTFRDDGVLYMQSQATFGLYTVDTATAEAALIGIVDMDLYGGDLTFDGEGRLILWTNDLGTQAGLYEVDPVSAAATLVDLEPGRRMTGLTALGHGNVLYGSSATDDRLYTLDPVVGFTGASVILRLDGAVYNIDRGDLDSPYCVDDAACDDGDPCTLDRCTPGGCRNLLEDATCDGIDDDCDGAIDEDVDRDHDGVADCFDNCAETANPEQADDDGDAIGNACDCAPGDPLNGPPQEVGNSLVLTGSGPTSLSWDDEGSGGEFRVYRGVKNPGEGWVYNQDCLGLSLTGTTVADEMVPAPGGVFFYFVARIGCGESILGRDSDGNPVPVGGGCAGTE